LSAQQLLREDPVPPNGEELSDARELALVIERVVVGLSPLGRELARERTCSVTERRCEPSAETTSTPT